MHWRAVIRLAPRRALRRRGLSTRELGEIGERLVERHLRRRGWRVLARRLKTRAAEVDLVVERDGELVCVEVKTGRVPFRERGGGGYEPQLDWRPGRHATERQLGRLWRAARSLRAAPGRRARVDLIEVLVEPRGSRLELLHHRACRRPPPPPGVFSR